ncbi:MAG: hypothetical protein ABJL35_03175 [Parasphingorhabdus sp.]|uniref:hypothetical protein n=1 Tax=Parasphingorhabdus sp. TaxID=2709688 RepID=UPI0032988DCA
MQTNQVDVTGPAIADLGEGRGPLAMHPLHKSDHLILAAAIQMAGCGDGIGVTGLA